MTISCETLKVNVKAKITATEMIIDKTECVEPCNAVVLITWTNTGGIPGVFEPAILVNNVKTGLGSNINLSPGLTYTESFDLNDLIASEYNICPDPN